MSMQALAMKIAIGLSLLAAIGVSRATGVEDGFNTAADDTVSIIVQQRNGQLLLGGKFTSIGGATRNHVARVNNDGSRSSFNPDVNGGAYPGVRALREQVDGSILIGGRFTTVSGQPRNNIARVSSAGTIDAGFDPGTDGRVDSITSWLAPDGLSELIYVAGSFNTVGGVARHGIARLHADGSIDSNFLPPDFNGYISSVEILPDGRILVAGNFSMIDGNDTDAPVARLNFDGRLDATFTPTMSHASTINDLAVQADGGILIAGSFVSVGGLTRNNIARLHANGHVDTGFEPPAFNNLIYSMVLQSDGRITVAGSFYDNNLGRAVVRLNANGSPDLSFHSYVLGAVLALVQQTDGKYPIGGAITNVNSVARQNIGRLNADGATDVDFIANLGDGPNVDANVLALQTDGKVLVGGQAASANSSLTRLHSDGRTDATFSSIIDGDVFSIASYPNGTTLVAGQFTNIGQRIVRLLDDGAADATFAASANGTVYATALQRNGRILLGGSFSQVDALVRHHMARLFDNGAPDLTFHPVFDGEVYAIMIQADGKSLVGGNFSVVNGQAHSNLVRLNTNGTIDAGFDVDVNDVVRAIATDAAGRVLIGGSFTNVDSTARAGIARLQTNGDLDSTFDPPGYSSGTTVTTIAPMTNGRILIGGFTLSSDATGFVRRLSSNGSQNAGLDPEFEEGSFVTSMLVQPDGKVLFGGRFSTVNGKARTNVARLAQLGSAIESVRLDNGADLNWERRGNDPELIAAPQVLWSLTCCGSADFKPLPSGIMNRNGTAWTLNGTPNLGPDTLFLRAVSVAGDGGHGVGTIESRIIRLPPDRIFNDGFE